MPVSISESAALNMPADDNEVITRGVTIHRYIDTMYDDASMPRVKYRCLEYKKTPLFWHGPHFHIISVKALPPMCAFSFNLTCQDSI